MDRDKLIALWFRIFAFLIVLGGIILDAKLNFNLGHFFYYTTQSNILVLVLFGVLIIHGIIDIKKNGRRGETGYHPVFSMSTLLCITYTLLIYWIFLSPHQRDINKILSLENLAVHLYCPILMMLDYTLFPRKVELTKRNVLRSVCLPIFWCVETTVLGFSKLVTFTSLDRVAYFPYTFLDYNFLGIWALAVTIVIALSYTISSIFLIQINKL